MIVELSEALALAQRDANECANQAVDARMELAELRRQIESKERKEQ